MKRLNKRLKKNKVAITYNDAEYDCIPRVNADNFSVNIISNQKQHLKNAVNMIFDGFGHLGVSHYQITKTKLILYRKYRSDSKENCKLPFDMDAKMTTDFIWNWLSTSAVFENEPDHDGSNSIAFKISNTENSSIWDSRKIIVETGFLMHGK